MEEVFEAIEIIKKSGNDKIILFHCTTNYPCDHKNVNLRSMQTLRDETGIPVGYSDHTVGLEVPKLAASLGAVAIERHFTMDKNLPGPDHRASSDPEELKELVRVIRNKEYDVPEDKKELILGSAEKKPTPEEIEISKIARKSIVANQEISKGTTIERKMLIIKRPGTGIIPKQLEKVLGKRTKEDIKKDTLLRWTDLE